MSSARNHSLTCALLALALVAGCSTASSTDPDATTGSPDGAATTPDAPTSTPDAPTAPPDAPSSTPDAMLAPDAMVSIPDAMLPPDATPAPDAMLPPDAMTTPDAGTGPCDPIAQTGCTGTDKCTWNSTTMATVCAANGTINPGNPCSYAASGIDNCTAGQQCINGLCEPICGTTPDTCAAGDSCVLFNMTFDDLTDVGVCQTGCDPLGPNCSAGDGCYLSISSGNSICSGPAATGTQDDACTYLNDCQPGHGCVLNDAPTNATGLTCAFYCDATSSGGPSCSDAGGPGSAYQCCEIRTFYSNSGNVPAGVGMCVETAVWGACP